MLPAAERLDAGGAPALEVDERLEVELELVRVDRVLQLGAQRQALEHAGVHGLLEDPVAALAVALAHVHRRVGVAHEVVSRDHRLVRLRHGHGDAEARAHDELLRLEADGHGERFHDAIGQIGDGLQTRGVLQEHRELVTAEARRGVGRTDRVDEPPADLTQHLVAHGMPEAVVDGLEVVEIEEDHADRLLPAIDARQRVLHAIGEERTVREPGHGIVEGLVRDLRLEHLPLGHVAAVQDDAPHVLVVDEVGRQHLEVDRAAVRVCELALERVRLRTSRRARSEHLREAPAVACGEQHGEGHAEDVIGGVAEDALDRRALVADRAVQVDHGHQVAGVAHERPEARLAVETMHPLDRGGARERERHAVAQRPERPDDQRREGRLGCDDDQSSALRGDDGERRPPHGETRHAELRPRLLREGAPSEPVGGAFDLERRACREHRIDVMGIAHDEQRAELAAEPHLARPGDQRDRRLACRRPDVRLVHRRRESRRAVAQRALARDRALVLVREADDAQDHEQEEHDRRSDDHEQVEVAVAELAHDLDRRRQHRRDREQCEATARKGALSVGTRVGQGAHRGIERDRAPQQVVADPAGVVDQLVVERAVQEGDAVGRIRREEQCRCSDQQDERARPPASVEDQPGNCREQQDVAERIGDGHDLRERSRAWRRRRTAPSGRSTRAGRLRA